MAWRRNSPVAWRAATSRSSTPARSEPGLAADRFSAAACFAVLHHTETAATQDRVFAELLRVLRPGGILVGSEGYDNERTRLAHVGDQFVPVDPEELPRRLEAIGFTGVEVEHGEFDFRFHARNPG